MFLTQAPSAQNPFWKYIVGSIIVIISAFIGQVPLLLAIGVEAGTSGRPFPVTNDQIMSFLDSNVTLFLLLLSFAFALAGLYFVVRVLHKMDFSTIVTTRKKLDWGRIFFAFGLWTVIAVVTTLIAWRLAPDDFVFQLRWDKFLILAAIAIVLIPVQTSVEEFIFRGYLMQGFANLAKNKLFPLIMTSVIFGVMHILNPEVDKLGYIIMVFYIGTGLFLGICTLMDDGMELALGFHAANNLIGALLVTADWTAFKTYSVFKDISDPQAGFDVLFPVLVVFPILLIIFSKRYNWSGWKEKLTGPILNADSHDNRNEPNLY